MCPAEVETMMYAGAYGKAPWWVSVEEGVATDVRELQSWDTAIVKAGLNWEVETRPLYTMTKEGKLTTFEHQDDSVFGRIDFARAVVRVTDGNVLGVVGADYVPVQNRDAFHFLDDIMDDSRPKYETAGSLRGGKRVWALARLPNDIYVKGVDLVQTYLLLTNGHDGFHSLMVAVTPVRVVCMNTLNMALWGTPRMWKTKHAGNVGDRIQAARQTLGLAFKYAGSFEKLANELAGITLSDAEMEAFVAQVFPADKKTNEVTKLTEERRAQTLSIAQTAEDLKDFRGTAWAFYNAVAVMNDHVIGATKKLDRRLETTWFDTQLKDRALAAVLDTRLP